MVILGVHRDPWHNTGAAMIRDDGSGPQYVMVSEERLDRLKDSRAFPELSIRACMRELGVESPDQIDLVVYDYIQHPNWNGDYFKKPSKANTILDHLPESRFHVINHHLAHAFSTFYSSKYSNAAILIVDGRGSDKETQSLFSGTPNGIQLIEKTSTIGVGLLYAAITQAIGFGLLQEGKTMGLAPYGANITQRIFEFPKNFKGIVTDYSSVCVEGNYELKVEYPPLATFELQARAAYEVQKACEDALLHLAAHAKKETGADYLCISGGVGLNSVANYLILRSGLFKDVFINPACSDTGIPLGCAMYGYHHLKQKPQRTTELTAFLGPSYSDGEIRAAVESQQSYKLITRNVMAETARMLADNKIVGFFQDRSEIGPRALGHRSILMSPLCSENKDIINAKVKHRESFRPFAPAVLVEDVEQYFEIDRPCPFMLMVPYVKEEKRSIIPAVTHVDGTGRVQTVDRKEDPYFYELINEFKKITGVPVILNTSFNDNGEPIVEAPIDAIRCFKTTNLDGLLIGNYLLVNTLDG